jgi:hypothetical protein
VLERRFEARVYAERGGVDGVWLRVRAPRSLVGKWRRFGV